MPDNNFLKCIEKERKNKGYNENDLEPRYARYHELQRTRFIPDEIYKYITRNSMESVVSHPNKYIRFEYILTPNDTMMEHLTVAKYISNMLKLTYKCITKQLKSNHKKTHINIRYFPTPFKKILKKSKSLGPSECNSGYTLINHLGSAEIVVFRQEEAMKVIIHELIHALELDTDFYPTGMYSSITDFIAIKSNNLPNEAYVEFWAETIKNKLLEVFHGLKFKNLMEREKIWSAKNVAAIMKYFNMKHIVNDIDKFSQTTAAYHYYVVKFALILNYEKSIKYLKYPGYKLKASEFKALKHMIIKYMKSPRLSIILTTGKPSTIRLLNKSLKMTTEL